MTVSNPRSTAMQRRNFIAGLSSAFWAAATRAEQSAAARKVGLLMSSRADDSYGQRQLKSFSFALGQLGWIDGRNVALMIRWSGGEPRLAEQYANELVELAPDVIVAGSTIGLDAARSATKKIPILFVGVSDPVAGGFVDSLAKPGGNITGFTSFDLETGGKWLEILKSVVPTASRIGVLMDPDYTSYTTRWLAMAELGQTFGIELTQVAIRARADVENAIAEFAREPNGALIVFSSALTTANSRLIVGLVERYRLPTIYPFSFFVTQGGLMSYGIDSTDLYSRSASYVDRILRGFNPADLPIQRPTKFEMVINLKTAAALGLSIPDKLLLMADEVIEQGGKVLSTRQLVVNPTVLVHPWSPDKTRVTQLDAMRATASAAYFEVNVRNYIITPESGPLAGGLMSQGENFSAMYRRAAYFVDRISKAQIPLIYLGTTR